MVFKTKAIPLLIRTLSDNSGEHPTKKRKEKTEKESAERNEKRLPRRQPASHR